MSTIVPYMLKFDSVLGPCVVRDMVGRKKGETAPIGVRLPPDVIDRADAYAEQLGREHPGMSYTRTDAIRIILATYLPPLPDGWKRSPAPSSRSKPSTKPSKRAKSAKRRP